MAAVANLSISPPDVPAILAAAEKEGAASGGVSGEGSVSEETSEGAGVEEVHMQESPEDTAAKVRESVRDSKAP